MTAPVGAGQASSSVFNIALTSHPPGLDSNQFLTFFTPVNQNRVPSAISPDEPHDR